MLISCFAVCYVHIVHMYYVHVYCNCIFTCVLCTCYMLCTYVLCTCLCNCMYNNTCSCYGCYMGYQCLLNVLQVIREM